MHKQLRLLLFILVLCMGGCGVKRDESTGRVRRIAADRLGIGLEQVKAESSLGSLKCTRPQFVALIQAIEDSFSTTITAKDEPRLGRDDDSWKEIRIIDLADIVRPEWSKQLRELEKKKVK